MTFMMIISPLISSSAKLRAAIIICVRVGCFVFELCCSCSCFVSHWASSQETRILSHEVCSCGRVVSAVCFVSLRCVPLDFPSLETRVLFLGLVRIILYAIRTSVFCSVCSMASVYRHCTGTMICQHDLPASPRRKCLEEKADVRRRQPKCPEPDWQCPGPDGQPAQAGEERPSAKSR